DWEAFNCHGATNEVTVNDWKAALDAVVRKQGVFTMIFHPHNWIRNNQLVELISYAATQYGKRIKFLNFREALERLNKNLLLGQPVRGVDGTDNGVRLLDLNSDGYLDVIVANQTRRTTRLWDSKNAHWTDAEFPAPIGSTSPAAVRGFHFGRLRSDGAVTAFFRNEDSRGAWYFDGQTWQEDARFFNGLTLKG